MRNVPDTVRYCWEKTEIPTSQGYVPPSDVRLRKYVPPLDVRVGQVMLRIYTSFRATARENSPDSNVSGPGLKPVKF